MKAKSIGVAILLSVASAGSMAQQSCANTFSLGTLGVNDYADHWRLFMQPQSFSDCFQFKLGELSDTSVISTTWDLSFKLNISLDSLSLWGAGFAQALTPGDEDGYTFTGLRSGDYTLAVGGNVTSTGSTWPSLGVGYGVAVATRAPTVVTPVPEPQAIAMLALGLGLVAWTTRRKAI